MFKVVACGMLQGFDGAQFSWPWFRQWCAWPPRSLAWLDNTRRNLSLLCRWKNSRIVFRTEAHAEWTAIEGWHLSDNRSLCC